MTAAGAAADGQPTVEQDALAAEVAARGGTAAPPVPSSTLDARPELAVGAAFAGGLVLGLLLKRLGR
jgi:hypothetical protein